ncbi:homoserine kinase [Nocardioides sp. cx-173]|uniref:homoserine kinase n=1 Tax=Nocardioides sp. cx-173 TaxID=2898796 RepID=UPI001E4D432F|nr:homoserine kinase [Nocardioides sp. cx-173]MCD4526187.1 homoserine kinase [Nocardioides sp. cx-173]UGB40600.1 homoserine kinase [Nocardioides sp. cx-173]
MPAFVAGPVRVSVPATSANLGPGFDSLGLALDLRDQLEGEILARGLVVEVQGAGGDDVARDESHLVVRSMRAGFEALGGQPEGLRLSCTNAIPHGRGLGSSSAAIVGGLALARALVVDGDRLLDDDALFCLAARIEGHPDNVAPAVHGGFVISGQEDGEFYAVGSPVDPAVAVVVFVPPTPVSTEVARGLLPAQVPHADAAADAGRTALLVAALAGRTDQLWRATRDYLHQDYRRPAMPQSLALVDALRADGVAALVSGAGPTVLALRAGDTSPDAATLLARAPEGWLALALRVDHDGVRAD